MISFLRLSAALVLAFLLTPALAWLILVCADFVGLENCLTPHPAWRAFSLVAAAALAFPPVLYLWPDRRRPTQELFVEACRAVLFAFALFALIFLSLLPLLTSFLPIPRVMLPVVMRSLSLLICCPFVWMSYAIARKLVPRMCPVLPQPSAVRLFNLSSLALTTFPLLCLPVFPEGAALFPPNVSILGWVFLLFSIRCALTVLGDGGVIPAWTIACLLHVFWMIMLLPRIEGAVFILALLLITLEIFSSVCILTPSCRHWTESV